MKSSHTAGPSGFSFLPLRLLALGALAPAVCGFGSCEPITIGSNNDPDAAMQVGPPGSAGPDATTTPDGAAAADAATAFDTGAPEDAGRVDGGSGACTRPTYPAGYTLCASGAISPAQAAAGCNPIQYIGVSLPGGASDCTSTTLSAGHWELWCNPSVAGGIDGGEPAIGAYLFAELDGILQTAATMCPASTPELLDLTVDVFDQYGNLFSAGGQGGAQMNQGTTVCLNTAEGLPAGGSAHVWLAGRTYQPGACPPGGNVCVMGSGSPQCSLEFPPDAGNGPTLLGFELSWP
jgi:hypothetical protein